MACSYIAFARIDRLENILRAEVTIVTGDAFKTRNQGKGYALIRFRNEKYDKLVEDPAVLTALQRALCVALLDSNLYKDSQVHTMFTPLPLLLPEACPLLMIHLNPLGNSSRITR